MKSALLALCGVFVASWFVFVWPTAWTVYSQKGYQVRVNRFTGKAQTLERGGWQGEKPPWKDYGSGKDVFDKVAEESK